MSGDRRVFELFRILKLLSLEASVHIRRGMFLSESEAKVSVNFVLNVLRQHENDLDRSIAEIELIKQKLEKLTSKIQQILDNFSQ